MKQISLATTGYELITKRTRKRIFLEEMNLVVPWTELVGLIQPHASPQPTSKGGRPAFRFETMLRIHFLQQWFGLKKTNINITGTLEAGLVILFVLLPVTIRLSSITYLLIEKPFLALRKNYIKKY